jgi:hypothetical protein
LYDVFSYIRIVISTINPYYAREMGMQDLSESETNVLPSWVLDPRVRDFLGSEGIEIVILKDEKYRRKQSTQPLVILRGLSPSNQYYLYADEHSDYEN